MNLKELYQIGERVGLTANAVLELSRKAPRMFATLAELDAVNGVVTDLSETQIVIQLGEEPNPLHITFQFDDDSDQSGPESCFLRLTDATPASQPIDLDADETEIAPTAPSAAAPNLVSLSQWAILQFLQLRQGLLLYELERMRRQAYGDLPGDEWKSKTDTGELPTLLPAEQSLYTTALQHLQELFPAGGARTHPHRGDREP